MNKKYLLAYTAGIVDGEGCIMIGKSQKRKTKVAYHQLQIWVTNTNLWLCEWLKMQYGGSLTMDKRGLSNNNLGTNTIHRWFLTGDAALKFIRMILPYLYLKKPQAELAINFQENRRGKGNLTEEQKLLREADYIRMRELKKLGLGL